MANKKKNGCGEGEQTDAVEAQSEKKRAYSRAYHAELSRYLISMLAFRLFAGVVCL